MNFHAFNQHKLRIASAFGAILLVGLCVLGVAYKLRHGSELETALKTLKVILTFGAIGVVLTLLEMLFPDAEGQEVKLTDRGLDLTAFLMNALPMVKVTALISATLLAFLGLIHMPQVPPNLISRQPKFVQIAEAFLFAELVAYWKHRLMHEVTWLWPFHAVHHSSEQITWHSTYRNHPFEEILGTLITLVPLYCLGISGVALGSIFIIRNAYDMFVHSNVSFTYGPLKYIFVSPAFHRWHHTSELEHIDRNYGTTLSCFDYIFGTATMPGRGSKTFGVIGEQVGRTYLHLLIYPFKKLWQMRKLSKKH